MRWLLTVLCSAAIGALAAVFVYTRLVAASLSSEPITTKLLVLLDQENRPAIRMQSLNGQTKMEFLANGNVPILALQVDRDTFSGKIEFTGNAGWPLAGIQVRPDSESQLFLGDSGMIGRVVLGAPGSDVSGDPSEMWGLQIQSRGAGGVTIGVANDKYKAPRGPFFGYYRPDGSFVPGAAIPKVQ
jgi:hypothetical protein